MKSSNANHTNRVIEYDYEVVSIIAPKCNYDERTTHSLFWLAYQQALPSEELTPPPSTNKSSHEPNDVNLDEKKEFPPPIKEKKKKKKKKKKTSRKVV